MSDYEKAASEMRSCGLKAFVRKSIYVEQLWIKMQVPGLGIFEQFQIDYNTVCEWSYRYDCNN